MEPQKDKIQENVLDKIRSSEVNMRPKFYHNLKVVLLVVVVFAILIISSLLFSFIIFTVKVSGHLFLIGFGERGLVAFFLLFPWKYLLVDILLIIALEWTLKQFRFGYRSPLAYLLAGIFIITVLAGILINALHLHEALLNQADKRDLPFMGDEYEHLRRPPPEQGVVTGVVEDASGTSFTLQSAGMFGTSTMLWEVVLPPGVTIGSLDRGDEVLVAGDVQGNMIKAYGLKKIDPIPEVYPAASTTMK